MYTEYERYILLADSKTGPLIGNYEGFQNFKEVIKVCETISQNRNTSYLYNGELINVKLTISEINTILKCWEEAKYSIGFNKVKLLAIQLGIRKI
tara:strand:+ start:168 stop:452 length:285 start_codon:yes stop_codon:yes gene_type:complete